ncbi:hypothetical protein, partial [Escherichia coli]|uniref:hypothetical protein n=1 Tax=Escherichia coli TaxID=562 RepID=UPI00201094E1
LSQRPPAGPLWPNSAIETIDLFAAAVSFLGLESLNPSRYSLRHGGASEDILSKARSVEAVKQRGHWKTDASLQKETRVLAEIRKAAPLVIEYG